METSTVRYDQRDDVALITLDDGKANALSRDTIDAVHQALDHAARDTRAVVLAGRTQRLSGGFDLRVMASGPEAARQLVTAGAELMLRIYDFPRPVIIACTGHALAAGAILLLVGDVRVGAAGDFKIGLNEVSIHMTLPIFALELARDRVSKRHFSRAVTQAHVFDPVAAQDAGYLDLVVAPDAVVDTALDQARRLAALPDPAFRHTKQRERAATIRRIRETLAADIAALTGAPA